jgi:rhomboid protease GluP
LAPIPLSQPLLTYILLGLNIILFMVDWAMGYQLSAWGAKENFRIANGEYWRLITPMFLHVNLIHLGLNSYSLYIIGPRVEGSYGHLRFMVIYLLSGVSGVVLSFMLGRYVSVGASGALFGLIGALLTMLYRNRNTLANTRERIISILQVIGINLVIGLGSSIDNWGHIGGLIGGLVLGWFSSPQYSVRMDINEVKLEDKSTITNTIYVSLLFSIFLSGVVMLVIMTQYGLL